MQQRDISPVFVLMNAHDSPLEDHIRSLGLKVTRLKYTHRLHLISCFFQLCWMFLKIRPSVVHAHLFEGSLAAIPASWLSGIKHRIYTRHHGNFHQAYHPHFVWLDRLINRMSTEIVAVSSNVKDILVNLEKVKPEKVKVVHHGFKLEKFFDAKKEAKNLTEYIPEGKGPVIGVISRYIHWKGIQYIIPAFHKILQNYPDAYLILANAKGEYRNKVKEHLGTLPANSYREIVFENNVPGLFGLFDVFVHVPVDAVSEAFGQVYIEALAAGIPSVFTLSGIANDFVEDNRNAVVVPFCDSDAIADALHRILSDNILRGKLSLQGRQDVTGEFSLDHMITALIEIYESRA
jgi:glycosyltransferase involved in cell wall biosynthesis